ncbi:unnamed protein product [Malassezia sympodialis ATCC 42132]|uniref:uncharacterized protein n=1 Tax=Malassezia sympodialis (strain ATCC 42132) TaxID=1230383 RepID=UPI0002C2AFA2|nr:uncharacterized protein MSY001_3286 [Malassezia sympodialis ATCC 42132]CCV00581.1 unnamed protein product [Malassezia sympodialis ATCC 42132]|eukprot:XP_018741767.1 uncharacterized protein MSY001_3286 [Malassezia sympodialis ATCC 42132]
MSEPPPLPCVVRGLRWGAITDTACLEKMLVYSLWMGEAHTPLACVAHALAQWHTSERVPFLMNRLRTPTQLRAQYHECTSEPSRIHTLDTHGKSKRKAVRTQRWQGFPAPFAWGTAHPAPAQSPVRDLEIRADQPALQALFDAYADQLCLLQLSAGLSLSRPMYGSDTRIQAANDERDEAQWFCADVAERYFEHLAPRMCATLRSKCFAPGPSLTPRRRRPWKRSVSAAKPGPAPEAPPVPQERHPILHAERTTRRSSLTSSTRISNEVVMSRRLVRPVSLQRTSSAPLTTTMASSAARPASVQAGKRQRTDSHEARAPAKTLVSATPERAPLQSMERPSTPDSSPPTSPTGLKGEPLGMDSALQPPAQPVRLTPVGAQASPACDRRSVSPSDAPRSRSMLQDRPMRSPDALARSLANMDEDESDVELVIPSSRKAAMYIDPLSYIG